MAASAGHGSKSCAARTAPTTISTHGTTTATGRPTPMSAACFGQAGPSISLNTPAATKATPTTTAAIVPSVSTFRAPVVPPPGR